jgi:uncharacterized Zn-binding protein involved in type VI secretion
MPAQGRLGDKAQITADAHGCPGCPHPGTGPAIAGSADVLVNGKPALRQGDGGIHAVCCGPNQWKAQQGSPTVFINGRAAFRMNDPSVHCGGVGQLVEGSPDVVVGGAAGAGTSTSDGASAGAASAQGNSSSDGDASADDSSNGASGDSSSSSDSSDSDSSDSSDSDSSDSDSSDSDSSDSDSSDSDSSDTESSDSDSSDSDSSDTESSDSDSSDTESSDKDSSDSDTASNDGESTDTESSDESTDTASTTDGDADQQQTGATSCSAWRDAIVTIAMGYIGKISNKPSSADPKKRIGGDLLVDIYNTAQASRPPTDEQLRAVPGEDRQAWCGIFAVACAVKAGVPNVKWENRHPTGLQTNPQPIEIRKGDILVVNPPQGDQNHHVIVASIDKNQFNKTVYHTVAGNVYKDGSNGNVGTDQYTSFQAYYRLCSG